MCPAVFGGALVASAPAQAQPTYQTSEMAPFDGFALEKGAGTLTRSADEIWLAVSAQGLDKKAAYTVWWVIFNNPGACDEDAGPPCSADDFFDADVDASVFYAAGFVTGTDGTANVTAHLSAGDTAEGVDVVIGIGGLFPNDSIAELGAGNGFDAEVHVVLRTHSATIEGLVADQISTFLGACGQTFCDDQHFLVFEANPPS